MLKTKKKKVSESPKKKAVLNKEREDNWRIPPSLGIPKYSADNDAHCPAGQMKKYNDEKRLNAKLLAEKDQRTEKWGKVALENNFKDVPIKISPSLRYKAMEALPENSKQEAMAEVEILQKIIVREGLLGELRKLVKSQNDVSNCLGEVIELVKALRYQTLDAIEDIHAWQDVQSVPRPFMFKGLNYLVKIKGDLDFLDLYDEVTERFCFEFKSNPLAYRDGGNLIIGYNFDRSDLHAANNLKNGITQKVVDGIDIMRLRNAEKIIQNEFNRLSKERNPKEESVDGLPVQQRHENGNKNESDPLTRVSSNSIERGGAIVQKVAKAKAKKKGKDSLRLSAASEEIDASADPNDMKFYYSKTPQKNFNPKKIKLERILTLEDEASELKAMMSHVEDKVKMLFEQGKDIGVKRKAYAVRLKEAQAQGKETAAQHIAAEMSVLAVQQQELQIQIKNLQREGYFINLERKRKLGVRQKLKDEMDEEKKRTLLKKTIEAKIKKEGLSSVLQALTDKKSLDQISQLMKDKQYPATRILVKTESTFDTGLSSSFSAPSIGPAGSPVNKGQHLLGGDSQYSMRNRSSVIEENMNFPSHAATFGDEDEEEGEEEEEEDDEEEDGGEGVGDDGDEDNNNVDAFFDDDANQSIYGKRQSTRSIAESRSPSALSVSPSDSPQADRSPRLSQHSQQPQPQPQPQPQKSPLSVQEQKQLSGSNSVSEINFNYDTYISDEESSPDKRRGSSLSYYSNGNINSSAMGSPLFENLQSSRRHDEDSKSTANRPSVNNRIDADDQVSAKGRDGLIQGSVRGASSLNNSEDSSYMRRPYSRRDGGGGEDDGEDEDEDGEGEGGEDNDEGEEDDDDDDNDDDDDDDEGEEERSASHYGSQSYSNDDHSSTQYSNAPPENRNEDGNLSLSMEENIPVGAALYVAKARKMSPRS